MMMLHLGLALQGRRVLLAGAGGSASPMVRQLLDAGADLVVVGREGSDDVAGWAGHGDLAWYERTPVPADLEGAWLVVAATDDPGLDAEVAAWAEERRTWCVTVSDPTRGSARKADPSRHAETALRGYRRGRGRVILVGSGPGDPGLITVRGRDALAEADVVVTDRLGATGLLSTLRDDVEVVHVGKSRGNHPVPQHDINRILVERAAAGKTVVRLKGGDPFVFGRGGEEVQACVAARVQVEVVPGVTSALSVPALAGIPVTHRGVARSLVVTTGHCGAEPAALAAITAGVTVVFLMGVNALGEICSAAVEAGADPATPVAIIERGSTPQQRVTRGDLLSITRCAAETRVKPPAVIVVGEVARAELLAGETCNTPSG